MPRIDLCFTGWLRGANVTDAVDQDGRPINVSMMSSQDLVKHLQDGTLSISLGDHLYESRKAEIEMFDFSESEG